MARQLLSEREEFADIELFSLRAIATGKRLDIRLDKMTGKGWWGGWVFQCWD